MTSREEFIKKLRETFKIEAKEGIAEMASTLIELERDQSDQRKSELVEAIFRNAHSLKGASRAVNFTEIEDICQSFEGVLSAIKNQLISLDPQMFDLFHQTVNMLSDLLVHSGSGYAQETIDKVEMLIEKLKLLELGDIEEMELTAAPQPEVPEILSKPEPTPTPQSKSIQPPKKEENEIANPIAASSGSTIRVSIEKLDSLLNQTEEMLSIKQIFGHLNLGLGSFSDKMLIWERELLATIPMIGEFRQLEEGNETSSSLEIKRKKVIHFFEWSASMVKNMESDLEKIRNLALQEGYNSGVKIESLLDDVKKIIAIPFSTILDGFPKAARDLAKDKGKMVTVELEGNELEIDRRILEELRSPLIHLLRNSIDHGIEVPDERRRKNKSEIGTIRIVVDRMENNRVGITFSDDGAGVNIEKIIRKFSKLEKESIAKQDTIDEKKLLESIFKSGFSTSEMITDLSGRGLGLSIVKEKVEQLGGTISVETSKDKGIKFKIDIPLSMVTFRGVNVLVGESEFVLPTSKIEKVLRIAKSEIKNIEGKATIPFQDRIIPLAYLSDVLGIPVEENEDLFAIVVILGANDTQIGFVVDDILEEEMILVKKFNNQLKRVRNISGATVMGSGKVIPTLHVSDLLKSASKETSRRIKEKVADKEKFSILVVEDSITSRMLLKNILETAGYKVSIAIDGVDGYTRLKENPVDLVVSDVDMPRLNGLDMTAKIRSDKSLSEIPVVLVTSLSKREDRERGLEVGASAYIVKSNFDQSNLLEVIEKLIGN